MIHYFSDGTWFDKGTEAHLQGEGREFPDGDKDGIFRGLRNGEWDEELCLFSEFKIIDDGYRD
jgi:hypothetical protein